MCVYASVYVHTQTHNHTPIHTHTHKYTHTPSNEKIMDKACVHTNTSHEPQPSLDPAPSPLPL